MLAAPAPLGAVRDDVETVSREDVDRFWAGKAMADSSYAGGLTLLEKLPPLRAGTPETVDVQVENRGGELWRWDGPIRLGSRWSSGETVVDGAHQPLAADLPAGGSQIVPLPLEPPGEGSWTLTIDLVHEHVRWFEQPLSVEADVAPRRLVAVLDPGASEALLATLATLDPEEEPLVVSAWADELARTFAGRVVPAPEDRTGFSLVLAGATRLVVPDELVLESRRRPLLAAVEAARRLGIPVVSVSGETLSAAGVARRRLR